MGSIPTRSRHSLRRAAALAVTAAALLLLPRSLHAQRPDTTVVPPDTARVSPAPTPVLGPPTGLDSLGPPITPRQAFFRSLLVPGWAQARLDRGLSGALFATIEVVSLSMWLQARSDLALARRFGRDSVLVGFTGGDPAAGVPPTPVFAPGPLSDRIRSREQQVEDWLVLLIFNHLISGIDGYVAAHLWDVPRRISVRPAPGGGTTVALRVPW